MNLNLPVWQQSLIIAVIFGVIALFPACAFDVDLPGPHLHSGLCPLNVPDHQQDHVDYLQQVLVPVPRLLAYSILIFVTLLFVLHKRVSVLAVSSIRSQSHALLEEATPPFQNSYLLELLSAGKLHPKTY